MKQVRVFIDADSCPREVRRYVLKRTEALSLPIVFVANRVIPTEHKPPLFKMVVCKRDSGAADDFIVQNVENSDVVVTRDVPLAARLVEKRVCVMNDRGTLFTIDNIREKLDDRNFDLQLAMIGFCGGSAAVYGKKEIEAFKQCFDSEVKRLVQRISLIW